MIQFNKQRIGKLIRSAFLIAWLSIMPIISSSPPGPPNQGDCMGIQCDNGGGG